MVKISDVTLRRGSVTDAAELAAFAARTFNETYSEEINPDDLRAHLATTFGLAQQTTELADPLVFTILARLNGQLVAYAQVRRNMPPPCVTHKDPIELYRFYVDQRAHGSGLASRLMQVVHQAARELQGRHIWLSVWEQNPRAIAFYKKEMFVDVGSSFYVLGPDKQKDRVLVASVQPRVPDALTLAQLGWRPFFQQQLRLEQWDYPVVRVIAQHRNRLGLLGEAGERGLDLLPDMPDITVGDWLVLSPDGKFYALLERQSLFRRKAAGSKVGEQLIAANVDTLFIVTSLNDDFNLNRIERYLSLANEVGATPVIILSKADLCDDPEMFSSQVQALDPLLMVVTINCLDADDIQQLSPWCKTGNTVALMGSSGVGKSTLVNTLLGKIIQSTGGIREDDSKGRHVTTGRSLHRIPRGGLLLDTPGMRELQLADCDAGVNTTFADITSLAERCRFGNCQHDSEPGCAVQNAIARGELKARRLASYQKLMREQAFNSATLAEKRARDKSFGKMIKSVLSDKKNFK